MDTIMIVKTVERIVQPLLDFEGLLLVDTSLTRGPQGWILRVLIDKEGGVTVDDCVRVSKELSHLLDVEDIVPTAYALEVSSPGLDRPLKTESDFVRFVGHDIKVQTKDYLSGRRNFKGRLLTCADRRIRIEVSDGQVFDIPIDLIRKAHLKIQLH
jgi:ribosome maturation factor RimP